MRRTVVGVATGGLFLLGFASVARAQSLPNGVAAGDVDQTSAVLWARSTALGEIVFEYTAHSSFIGARTITAKVTDPSVPIKVDAGPLMPNTTYFYRATDAEGATAEGTFRTPAAVGFHGLRFGVSGDWRGELRPYPSISNMVERDLDFFAALGDTVYADVPSLDFPEPQAQSLEDFRIKHNEVYSERYGMNTWADIRASTAIYVTLDDHEVTNDFAGGAPPESDPRFADTGTYINETDLFHNGLQAFQEYNPVRDEYYGHTGDPRTAGKRKLYRFRRFGQDAAMMMLDARSFRDEGLPELVEPPGSLEFRRYEEASFDPYRTMLGAVQLEELMDDLLFAEREGITWKFVLVPEPIQNLGPILASDRFEGYAHERTELLSFIDDHDLHNVVFVAADIHGTVVNDLSYQLRAGGRQIRTSMLEITTGSVAYAAPFGPTTMTYAPPVISDWYDRLDQEGQNNLLRVVGNFMLSLYGYPPIGLQGGRVDARLLDGGYVAVNTYGWTEFEIDAATQCLTVTTYGIDWYTPEEMEFRPDPILRRTPRVVSRFNVNPRGDFGTASSSATDVGGHCPRPTPCGVLGTVNLGALTMMLSLQFLVRRRILQRKRYVRLATSAFGAQPRSRGLPAQAGLRPAVYGWSGEELSVLSARFNGLDRNEGQPTEAHSGSPLKRADPGGIRHPVHQS